MTHIWTWGDKPAVKPFASDSLRASALIRESDANKKRIRYRLSR